MEVIVKYHGAISEITESIGGRAEILSPDYAILSIGDDRLNELYSFSEVEDIEMPRRLFAESDYHLTSSCISGVQAPPYDLGGNGVIVAVIDSGIDYTHPDFRNDDGTTRLIGLWDQSIEGIPPAGFFEGAEYDSEQINAALQSEDPLSLLPSEDRIGHGTAVAGIAAGNGRASAGEYMGAAPLADLLCVKAGSGGKDYFARTTDIMRAMRYVIDKSRKYAMPVAVNLSFGMNNGAHDGSSLFEEFITECANEWKCVIVVPTGNEGASGHHFSGRVENGRTKEISFFTASGINTIYLSLWKNFADRFSVELLLPSGMSTGPIDVETGRKVVRSGGLSVSVVYGQPSRYSADQEIYFSVTSDTGSVPAGAWILRILPRNIVNGSVDLWLPTTEEVTEGTYFSDPDVYGTMTLPATAQKVIRVAGYNDRLGSIAPFSGVGRRETPDLMPDLAAPAVGIMAARPGGSYDRVTGTSFAAPFVTGSAALLMEWAIADGNAPFFYGEKLKAFLRLGANRKPDRRYPDPAFGYGTLCTEQTLRAMTDLLSGTGGRYDFS